MKIHRMVSNFNPETSDLDKLALDHVTQKSTNEMSEAELKVCSREFKDMLELNIEILNKDNSKFSFLKKVQLLPEVPDVPSALNEGNLESAHGNLSTILHKHDLNEDKPFKDELDS